MLGLVLAAQVADGGGTAQAFDPSLWEQFGPFAIVFVLMAAAIAWLLRERAKALAAHEADVAAYRAQIQARDQATTELYDRLLEQTERQTPLLERCARALERVAGGA